MKNQTYNLKYERILPLVIKITDLLPRKHKIFQPFDDNFPDPFFIIGSGRNGSTLLASMLNQHSKLMITPEQWVLYEMIIKFKLFNLLPRKDLKNLIVGLISTSDSNNDWDTDFRPVLDRLQKIPDHQFSLRRIIHEIFTEQGRQNGQDFVSWGDKSPLNIIYLEYIYPVFNKSKFIFLIRDGRDVVSSMVKNNNRKFEFAMWKWNYSVKQYLWLKKRIPGNLLHVVRYEDLVNNTEQTLKELMQFLGFVYESSMLDYKQSIEHLKVADKTHHKNLKKDVTSTKIGVWEKRLSDEQIDQVNEKLKTNLEKFNYI